jgi:hypothetical protein
MVECGYLQDDSVFHLFFQIYLDGAMIALTVRKETLPSNE